MADDKEEEYGPEEEPLEHKANRKRKENSKLDSYENKNPFTRENMKELTGEGKATWKKGVDFVLDTGVPILFGFAASKGLKLPEKYKGAKLREAASTASFKYTTPKALQEGKVVNPRGMLDHAIYSIWGKDYRKKIGEEAEKIADKVFASKINKGELSVEEAKKVAEAIHNGKLTPQAKEIQDEITSKLSIWVEKNVPNAQDKVNQHINLQTDGKGNVRVDIPKTDKITRNLPTIAATSIAIGEANTAMKDLSKFFPDPDEYHKKLLANEKGLVSTGLPTLSEISEGLGFAYNKKEAIKECNKIFDYIMENGDEEQLKRAYEIYGNTNFDKKKEAISSLKSLLRLAD